MEREQANAIISLARTSDWEYLRGYVSQAVSEMETSLGYMDPTDALGISRVQGAINALKNLIKLDELAHETINKEES